jgi:hypothetical protein
LAQIRVHHLGKDDGVDPDTAACPLGAQLAGHLRDAAHGRAVGHVPAPHGRETCHGDDVDDTALAGGQHAVSGLLAAEEAAQHQALDRSAHVVDVELFRRFEGDGAAGDVGEHVDPAELGVQALEHRADLLRV